eukprot:m.10890 g.10890  ORF g.10890 m.10890 type:complete len:69 (+) comp5628_c0_seq2:511-717(+)
MDGVMVNRWSTGSGTLSPSRSLEVDLSKDKIVHLENDIMMLNYVKSKGTAAKPNVVGQAATNTNSSKG